jgi:hypothetical protein
MIFSIFLAVVLFIFGFVSSGHLLLGWISSNSKFNAFERLLAGSFLGITFVVTFLVVLSLLLDPSTAYFAIIGFGLLGLSNLKKFSSDCSWTLKSSQKNWLISIFSLVAVFSLASTMIFSGISRNGDLNFQEVHDSTWHLALIDGLVEEFPPHHPSFPQVKLEQYHYFYDVMLASLHSVSGATTMSLYFQVFPLILSGLLVGSAAALGWRLKKQDGAFWLVFLTAFAGSFAYLIPVFIPGNTWGESSFWVSQTFVMLVNPQVIFTLGLTYIVLLISGFVDRLRWNQHLLLILLIAPSIGFKSYSWVIFASVYGSLLLWELIKFRKKIVFIYGFLFSAISLPFIWLITGFKSGTFFYFPLWYLDSMVEISDRLNLVDWKLKEDHYRLKNNWLRVWEIKIKELLIFYFGNLGVRSFFIGLIGLLFYKGFKTKNLKVIYLSIVGFLVSTIFPLLFLQRGVVWNSIQFWYYGLIFANVMAAIILSLVTTRLNKFSKYFFIVGIFIIATPTYLKTVNQKLLSRESFDQELVDVFSQYHSVDNVLVCQEGSVYFDTNLISALSPAKVYLADKIQLELMNLSVEPAEELKTIFETNDQTKLMNLIQDNQINKIVCTDGNRIQMINSTLAGQNEYNFVTDIYGNVNIYSLEHINYHNSF